MSSHEASCYWQNYPETAQEYLRYGLDLSDQHAQESFDLQPYRNVDCVLPSDTMAVQSFKDMSTPPKPLMLGAPAPNPEEVKVAQEKQLEEDEAKRKVEADAHVAALKLAEAAQNAASDKEMAKLNQQLD